MAGNRKIVAVAASVAVVAIAGCGGSDEPEGRLLPPATAETLRAHLDSIGNRVADGSAGACDDIYRPKTEEGDIEPIDEALASIPPAVDDDIRSALAQSIDRLKQLVDRRCDEIRAEEQEEQPPVVEEPVPTETDIQPPETVPPETVPTETEPTETEPPPQGNGNGGDSGGGNGRGNGGGKGGNGRGDGGGGSGGDGSPGEQDGPTDGGVEAPEGG